MPKLVVAGHLVSDEWPAGNSWYVHFNVITYKFHMSFFMFLTGFVWGLVKIFVYGERYGPTSAMLMTMAVVVFMVGLVSEQVAQLRFDRSEERNPLPPES